MQSLWLYTYIKYQENTYTYFRCFRRTMHTECTKYTDIACVRKREHRELISNKDMNIEHIDHFTRSFHSPPQRRRRRLSFFTVFLIQ